MLAIDAVRALLPARVVTVSPPLSPDASGAKNAGKKYKTPERVLSRLLLRREE